MQRAAYKLGTLSDGTFHDIGSMFDDVFEETPWYLKDQAAEMMAEVKAARA